MIASDTNLISMQACAKAGKEFGRSESEIAQESDSILRLNKSILIRHKFLIHLLAD